MRQHRCNLRPCLGQQRGGAVPTLGLCLAAWLSALAGCQFDPLSLARPAGAAARAAPAPATLAPVPVQQFQAYPELATGRFISLADFEDSPAYGPGHRQIEQFYIHPNLPHADRRYVVNITRTGAGAMEVNLPPGSALVYNLSEVSDFSAHTLLSVAIYSREIRDDLKVLLSTDKSGWESLPVLLRAGWNTVTVDLQRLSGRKDFDAHGVRSIRFWFESNVPQVAAAPSATTSPAPPEQAGVRFNLDDILLVDNRRQIEPTPPGVRLLKSGLDYEIHLPGRPGPLHLRQGDDGLWRLGDDQPAVRLLRSTGILPVSPTAVSALGKEKAATGETAVLPTGETPVPGAVVASSATTFAASSAQVGKPVPPGEDLRAFGDRRVGEVELLEANPVRLRIANAWYFPLSGGPWLSLNIRQVRWEHTFYADGRWVTELLINNAGGDDVPGVRLGLGATVWPPGRTPPAPDQLLGLGGGVGRWSWMVGPDAPRRGPIEQAYRRPGRIELRIGQREPCDGDSDGDGFDESQGCWSLRARAGHCRFRLAPDGADLIDPVIRVHGDWTGPVSASCEGLPLRETVRLSDGSVLLVLPGAHAEPRWVEITGPAGLLEGR